MIAGHLFDGAGGMRLGFEQSGIQTAWTLDILYGQDITKAHPREFRLVDVLCGGPPCVSTSKVASLSGRKTNQSLWSEMLRFIQEIKPQWVVVEQPDVDRDIILQWCYELQCSGYGCAARIIDSRHWLPQQRSRWFVVGRMETDGMALWNHLYPSWERMESRPHTSERGLIYPGSCSDCMPSGVFAGIPARIPALVGAGNAVSVPVARFIAEQIIRAEKEMSLSC